MKTTILNIINQDEWADYGLRAMTINQETGEEDVCEVGAILNNSYVWDDGCTTDEELDGTSALRIHEENIDQIIEQIKDYRGKIVLVKGNALYEGNDLNEIIMENAEIMAIF